MKKGIGKIKHNKGKLNEFNVFLFVSTFARSLIEIFISLYLFKNGFSIQQVLFFYLLENLFSFFISYFFVRIGERFNYSVIMYIGVVSFIALQITLGNVDHNVWYVVLISLLYAIYRRGYWVARRFYITEIMPQRRSSIPYSMTMIVSEVATILAGFLGAFLLDGLNNSILMIISSVLLFVSILPLWRIDSKGNNTKIELIKHLKCYDKRNFLAFSLYEINNVLTLLFPIYVFLYIEDTYMITGTMSVISNIAIIVFIFLYGKIIEKRNFFVLSTVLFVLVCLTKLFFLNYFILAICFAEGLVSKMQNQSVNKIYFENRNDMDLAHYNLIYQLLEAFARVIAVIPLLFISDVRSMIMFVLLIISAELVAYTFLKKMGVPKKRYVIGKNVDLAPVEIKDVDKAMRFQSMIIKGMKNKEWFTPLTKKEFTTPMKGSDNVYFLKKGRAVIGLVVATCGAPEVLKDYKLKNDNVLLIDSIMIRKECRGHHLQKQILKVLEKRAKELELDGLVATVHPDNIYSKKNFVDSGYVVTHSASLHGGERLVFVKYGIRKEKSCGCIILKDSKVLLICTRDDGGKQYWSFPKGHQEKGETDIETALRETKEEVGLDVKILSEKPLTTWHLVHSGTVHKDILLFVAEPLNDEIKMQAGEVEKTEWVEIDKVDGYLDEYYSDVWGKFLKNYWLKARGGNAE
ncbi:MFS transporter [Candidatus Saccharibacteria bacterium]|nr:MFS transporter [Candidatus Saccharibacteria bacterium]